MTKVVIGYVIPKNNSKTDWKMASIDGTMVEFSVDAAERWAIKNLHRASQTIIKSEIKIQNGKLLRFRFPYQSEIL